MSDISAAIDGLLAAFERHPGHTPQSVHGKKGVKNLVDSPAPAKTAWGADVTPEPPRKPVRPRPKSKPATQPDPAFAAQVKAKMANQDKDWVDKLQAAGIPKSAWGAPMPAEAPRPVRPPSKVTLSKMAKAATKLKTMTPEQIAADEDFKAELAALVKKAQALGLPLSAWGGLSPQAQAAVGVPKSPRGHDEDLNYHRGYTTEHGGTPGDPIRFVASTPGVKRDGLDLRANGWRLDNYHKSPVFQWCHDKTMPPLGRVEAEARSTLDTLVYFDQEDDFARKVESKYRRGFLHAVSVGWDFVDGSGVRLNTGRLSLADIRERAYYDLTELSGVPVPADPDALVQRTRAGLRSLGRELVSLYDEQEHGQALAEEVRQALYDELRRLGIDLQPADPAGFFVPETTAPAAPAIDRRSARNLAAAFTFLKEPTR